MEDEASTPESISYVELPEGSFPLWSFAVTSFFAEDGKNCWLMAMSGDGSATDIVGTIQQALFQIQLSNLMQNEDEDDD